MENLCLLHLKENMYRAVDCETGDPISFNSKKKSKRKPSKYNLHMKECLNKNSGPIKKRFKECAIEWGNKK